MKAMNESNRGQQLNAEPERESVDREPRPPYWKGAHRDWRIWVALVFMFAAIAIYVLSDDLTFLPHAR